MKDGKLFGKINIIDLLVAIIVVAAVGAVALKMSGRLGPAVVEVGTDITYTVRVKGVEKEVYEDVLEFIDAAKEAGYEGDQLMSNGTLLSAYVTDAIAVPHEAKAVISSIKTELGSQEVRVGKTHIVKTTHFELNGGIVLTCEWASGTGAERQPVA